MLRIMPMKLAALFLIGLSACSATPNEVVIALLETEQEAAEYQSRLTMAGGTLAAPILRDTGQLTNAALPENTSNLNGGLLAISQFEDRGAQSAFVTQSLEVRDTSMLATGRTIGWLPFVGKPAGFSEIETNRAPAFTLVNFIEQRPLANPVNGIRMLRYMSVATPLLRENGVTFITPILFDEVLIGHRNPDTLFLTSWPDLDAFETVHTNSTFITAAQTNRNRAVTGFTENGAMACPHWVVRFDC